MKTDEQIRQRIEEEKEFLKTQGGHMASITRGWLEALEWALDTEL